MINSLVMPRDLRILPVFYIPVSIIFSITVILVVLPFVILIYTVALWEERLVAALSNK